MKILPMILLIVAFLIKKSLQTPIYKQSDRIFIQHMSQINGNNIVSPETYKDFEIVFPPGQFKNTPYVLYSTTMYESYGIICASQYYSITTIYLSAVKLQYRVQSKHCQLISLQLNVLATDDPTIEIVNKDVLFKQQTETITFQGKSKILYFTPFICGFKRNSPEKFSLSQNIAKVDDKKYTLTLKQVNMEMVHLNYLVIYEDDSLNLLSSLYQYKQIIDPLTHDLMKLPQGIVEKEWVENTDLPDGSVVLFGLKDFNISTKHLLFSGFVLRKNYVQSKKVNLVYYRYDNAQCFVSEMNGVQIQFMMKTCSPGQYMFINPINKQSDCTVNCSGLNHHYYNNPIPQTLYTAQILICSICNQNCFGCVDSDPEKCLDCFDGKYLNPFTQKCQDIKPTGSYCNLETVAGQKYNNCKKCHENCNECSGGGSNECISCKTTQSQTSAYLFLGSCSPTQPIKTFCRKII